MDAKSFRRLCATLGSLTGPQLKELRAALRSLDARMQAIGAIEKRREGPCMSALQSRQEYSLGLDADWRPAVAVPILQADLFFIDGTALARVHSPAAFIRWSPTCSAIIPVRVADWAGRSLSTR